MEDSLFISRPFHSFISQCVDFSGMAEAQVRIFVLWILSMPLGFLMYYGLPPSRTSPTVRHIYSTSLGVVMGLLCFGWEMLIVLVSVLVSYGMLVFCSPARVQRYMMVYIIATIASAHVYRMIVDYGGYTVDYTIPLMMLVQKFTLTAYSIHDGLARKDEDLSADQRKMKMTEVPSLLSYLSYCFNFFQFLTGPSCTYSEYNAFVQGTNLLDNPNKSAQDKTHPARISPVMPWLKSLGGALCSSAIFLSLRGVFTLESNLDPVANESRSFVQRLLYTLTLAFILRCRYYMGWKFVEASSNAAGLGFSGYDQEGNPQWELSKNCHPLGYEFGTNARESIGSWNISANVWLRRVCYDRVPFQRTTITFLLSAFWHGFYPGYYFCFVSLAVLVSAARKGRSIFRPYFATTPALHSCYNIITIILTQVLLSGCGLSFQYLYFGDAVKSYTNLYCLLIIIPFAFLIIPFKAKSKTGRKKSEMIAKVLTIPQEAKEIEDLPDIASDSNLEVRPVSSAMVGSERNEKEEERSGKLGPNLLPSNERRLSAESVDVSDQEARGPELKVKAE